MATSFEKGQRRVAILWFCGSGLAMTILIAQSIAKDWGEWTSDAWSWLLPTIVPTLTLIVSTVVVEANQNQKPKPNAEVSSFAYGLCLGLSTFYLLCVLTVLISVNFVPMKPLELMKMSSLWLAPLQGLLSGIIGVFFAKRPDTKAQQEPHDVGDGAVADSG